MYGCTVALLLFVLPAFLLFYPGSTEARSLFTRQQKSHFSPHNCTEDDLSITVKCRHSKPEGDRVDPSASNRSMCCSSGLFHSSHHRNPCDSQHNHSSPSSVAWSQVCVRYELMSCAGATISLVCDVSLTCNDRVTWRRIPDGRIMRSRIFQLKNVQRRDIGVYLCEVSDYFGKPRLTGQVTLTVEFPPVILVPNQTEVMDRLECTSEANPPASITWYKDDTPLSTGWYSISSETSHWTTLSRVQPSRNSSFFQVFENYTCVASNPHGHASLTLLFAVPLEETADEVITERRRFNVTGFIVGMLPPLFISFYIILKLGYRSRYAEEGGEDDGFRDEPFFISY